MWQSTGIFIDESESLPFRVRVATCRHLPPAHVDISLAITKNINNNGDNGNLTPSHSSSIKINNLFTHKLSQFATQVIAFVVVPFFRTWKAFNINGIDRKCSQLIAFPFIMKFITIFLLIFSEPQFKRFRHIWKRSKKSQTPQQTRKVCESHYYCWCCSPYSASTYMVTT